MDNPVAARRLQSTKNNKWPNILKFILLIRNCG